MATLIVLAEDSALLSSEDAVYATARAGAGIVVKNTAVLQIGQVLSAFPEYFCANTLLSFDTSTLPSNATLISVILSLYFDFEQAGQDFTIEAREYDFGPTIEIGDFVAGAAVGALPLVASMLRSATTLNQYNDLTTGAAFLGIVNRTASTRILVASDRFRLGLAPAGFTERIDAQTHEEPNPPQLRIVYSVPGEPIPIHDPGGSFTRRMSGGRGGFLSYITPDGRTYPFHTPHNIGRWVISFSGFGTPPIEYITERGPFQHGATVRDYFLRPRVIQLLIRQGFCDRVAWWGGRANLLNEIRPNRQATPTGVQPGELQLVETDGTIRSLNVFIQEGPRFEPRESGQWDEWAFQEVLRFIAYDPVAFDPTEVTAAFPVAVEAELVFPITFPITFGTGDLDETLLVTYPGTWLSFPIITIVGPIDEPRLDNVTTGEKIEFSTNIAVGRTVTIDLREGFKTVVDDLGNNLIGQVTPDSDLGTFHLAPDPEAPGGVNTLRLRGSNPTGGTELSLAYFERYFGF